MSQSIQLLTQKKLDFNESLESLRSLISTDDEKSLFMTLEFRDHLHDSCQQILDSILIERGLYPYVKEKPLGNEALAFEFHRSEHLPFVYHREQRNILSHLDGGRSVVLSAPTSFGKSLLIEEIVASQRFSNIVIIQPTLALLDETRKKLKNHSSYKLIYSKTQQPDEKNVFLLTAERFIEFPFDINVDFFIIDEFYKLNFEGPDRRDILNTAFYKLLKQCPRFYLLGPQVNFRNDALSSVTGCEIIKTDFKTVTATREFVGQRTLENLLTQLSSIDGQSLIYVRSPSAAETLATELSSKSNNQIQDHKDFISWGANNVHPEWDLFKALKTGIGFHHGQMPRYVGSYVVDAFNTGKIKTLVCTSTLMEGVNTAAKNVLIYDLTKGKTEKLTALDVRNMSGRAGRMRRYFVGKVLIFGQDQTFLEEDLSIPSLEPHLASDELLIQIQESDLDQTTKERKKAIESSTDIPLHILKNNAGIPIECQIKLYNKLLAADPTLYDALRWHGPPDWNQLLNTCNLLFECFIQRPDGLLNSGKSIAYFVDIYRRYGSSAAVINYLVDEKNESVGKAIRETFGRIRAWFEFRLPKYLIGAQEIIVFASAKRNISMKGMDYTFFAGSLENGFLPANVSALKEIGLPMELLKKYANKLDMNQQPEMIVAALKRLSLEGELHPFEERLIKDL